MHNNCEPYVYTYYKENIILCRLKFDPNAETFPYFYLDKTRDRHKCMAKRSGRDPITQYGEQDFAFISVLLVLLNVG